MAWSTFGDVCASVSGPGETAGMHGYRFQFTTRAILAAVAIFAFYLGLGLQLGAYAVSFLLCCLGFSCFGKPESGLNANFVAIVLAQQIGLSAAVCWSAYMYYVYGAYEGIVWWICWVIPLAVTSTTLTGCKFYRASLLVIILFVLAISPFSAYRGDVALVLRLLDLREEVKKIVSYVEQQESETGIYPTDLSGYGFKRPALAKCIDYRPGVRWLGDPRDGYMIDYHPFSDMGIQHWYSPTYGWGYNDD